MIVDFMVTLDGSGKIKSFMTSLAWGKVLLRDNADDGEIDSDEENLMGSCTINTSTHPNKEGNFMKRVHLIYFGK